MPKIIQISACGTHEDETVFGLSDVGLFYRWGHKTVPILNPDPMGKTHKIIYGWVLQEDQINIAQSEKSQKLIDFYERN